MTSEEEFIKEVEVMKTAVRLMDLRVENLGFDTKYEIPIYLESIELHILRVHYAEACIAMKDKINKKELEWHSHQVT